MDNKNLLTLVDEEDFHIGIQKLVFPLKYEYVFNSFNILFQAKRIEFTDLVISNFESYEHANQDLCFRYKDKVFSILFAYGCFVDDNNIYACKQDIERLVEEARCNNFIPCIFPIGEEGDPILDGWHMINAITNERVDVEELAGDGTDTWSEWEYDNFGLNAVIAYLKDNAVSLGVKEDTIASNSFRYPIMCLWDDNDGKSNLALIRTVPAGRADEPYEIYEDFLSDISEFTIFFANICVCSMWNDLSFQETEIHRIAPVYKPIISLEPLEEAIEKYEYIKLIKE